tara:strand:- start:1051 stop:1689 length:639 start_codon:yes stop_codon:yes gene_type:complete
MKNNFVKTFALSLLILTPALASDTEQEAPDCSSGSLLILTPALASDIDLGSDTEQTEIDYSSGLCASPAFYGGVLPVFQYPTPTPADEALTPHSQTLLVPSPNFDDGTKELGIFESAAQQYIEELTQGNTANISEAQEIQRLLHKKVLANEQTQSEGYFFLALTKALQEKGGDLVFKRNKQPEASGAEEATSTTPSSTSPSKKSFFNRFKKS